MLTNSFNKCITNTYSVAATVLDVGYILMNRKDSPALIGKLNFVRVDG